MIEQPDNDDEEEMHVDQMSKMSLQMKHRWQKIM